MPRGSSDLGARERTAILAPGQLLAVVLAVPLVRTISRGLGRGWPRRGPAGAASRVGVQRPMGRRWLSALFWPWSCSARPATPTIGAELDGEGLPRSGESWAGQAKLRGPGQRCLHAHQSLPGAPLSSVAALLQPPLRTGVLGALPAAALPALRRPQTEPYRTTPACHDPGDIQLQKG